MWNAKAALLIEASNVTGQLEIPGARLDVLNWNNYLQSDMGGVWTNIETKAKPSKTEVRDYLKLIGASNSYVFVVFSGHGRYDTATKRTIVLLNDYQEMDATELIPDCYSTLIVDACRGVEAPQQVTNLALGRSEQLMEFRAKAFAKSAGYISNEYQTLFDSTLAKYDGKTTMYSCSVGEAADENPNSGGVYTTALHRACRGWHDSDLATPRVFTTYSAHEAVTRYLASRRSDQTPEYRRAGNAEYFPLAVRP